MNKMLFMSNRKCYLCDKVAVVLDAFHPYYTEYSRCKDHVNV